MKKFNLIWIIALFLLIIPSNVNSSIFKPDGIETINVTPFADYGNTRIFNPRYNIGRIAEREFGFEFNESFLKAKERGFENLGFMLNASDYTKSPNSPYMLERSLNFTIPVRNEIGQFEEREMKRFIDFSAIFHKGNNLNSSYSFTKSGKLWIIKFFNIFDLDPSFIDDTDSNWNSGTFNRMFTAGTGASANLSANNISGHFASQIFDSVNTNADWTNVSIVTEAHYGVEIGRAGIDTAQGSDYFHDWNNSALPYVNTSGLVLLMHFNNETGENDSLARDFSVDVNSERSGLAENNGTLKNGASYNLTDKAFGTASMNFDKADDVINTTSDTSLDNLTNLTVSAWVYAKSEGESTGGVIVSKMNGTSFPFTNGWMFGIESGSPTNSLSFNAGFSTTNLRFNTVDNALRLNQWAHVAVRWTGSPVSLSAIDIYVNGATAGEGCAFCSTNGAGARRDDSANYLTIGNGDKGTGTWDGLIDEVTIWNRTLSANEIRNLYLRGAYRLNLSARSCDDSACSGESWTQIINQSGSNTLNGSKMAMDLAKNRYFQYNITYSNLSAYATRLNVNNVSIELDNATETTKPIVNTTFNTTSPRNIDVINFTGNVTDDVGLLWANITYNLSGIITYVNFTGLSGTATQVSNATKITTGAGSVINFTMYATDTSNNVKQNSTLIIVADTLGFIQIGLNMSTIKKNDVVNVSGNITDIDGNIAYGWVTYNNSGGSVSNNTFLLSGFNANFSQAVIINLTRANVWNFTIYYNDTYGTTLQNSTIFTILNTAPNSTSITNISGISATNNLTLNWTASSDSDNDIIYYIIYYNQTSNFVRLSNTTSLNVTTNLTIGNYSLLVNTTDLDLTTEGIYFHFNINSSTITLPPPPFLPQEGSTGTSGTSFNENLILLQFAQLLTNYTLNLISLFTQPRLDDVLEYRLITPTQAQQGEIIQVTNLFTNEGTKETEFNCLNFLDINRNGLYDLTEPIESFNKKATPKIQNSITTLIKIPETIEDNIYLIAGICSPQNNQSIKIYSINKMEIRSNKGLFSRFFEWVRGLLGLSRKNPELSVLGGSTPIAEQQPITQQISSGFENTKENTKQVFNQYKWLPYAIIGIVIAGFAIYAFGLYAPIWALIMSLGLWGYIIIMIVIIVLYMLFRYF